MACLLASASSETSAQTVSGRAVKNAIESYLKQFNSPSVETVLEYEDLKPDYPIGMQRSQTERHISQLGDKEGLGHFSRESSRFYPRRRFKRDNTGDG